MDARDVPEKFLVAFSFAGEQRARVRAIAEAVEALLGRGTVFYDDWFEYYIAGPGADLRLQRIYNQQAELVVCCVSARYGDKPWTRIEHEAIRSLQMRLYESKNERDSLRILPLRVGDGDVDGILITTICPDVRETPPAEVAKRIVSRLRLIVPGLRTDAPPRAVYLAEGTPELDSHEKTVSRERLKAFIEDLDLAVVPCGDCVARQDRTEIDDELRGCVAFVQLIGAKPRPDGRDRIQDEAARALGLPRFRFRSTDVNIGSIAAADRDYVLAPDIIAGGFEDFKVHLKKKLTVVAQRRVYDAASERSPDLTAVDAAAGNAGRPADEGGQPLVIVAIHSANPDPLWDQVFQWLYEEQQIDSFQLRTGETLESKHRGEPCHGVLVVCDGTTLEDGSLSPRETMEQCRLIQMKEKDAARRPPVGLVYWPPPAPLWARLLRCTPLKLHRIMGDAPGNLVEFLAEVRKAAS